MVTMQQVSNHLRAFPRPSAVMVAVEICSAAYFLDDRLESAVAHAIFADTAVAIAIGPDGGTRDRRARPPSRSGVAPPWGWRTKPAPHRWCAAGAGGVKGAAP